MDQYFIPDIEKLINSYVTYEKTWSDQFLKDTENDYIELTHNGHYDSHVVLTYRNKLSNLSTYFTSLRYNGQISFEQFKDIYVLTNDKIAHIAQTIQMNDYKNSQDTCYRIERYGEILTLRGINNIIVGIGKTFNELLVDLYDDVVKL